MMKLINLHKKQIFQGWVIISALITGTFVQSNEQLVAMVPVKSAKIKVYRQSEIRGEQIQLADIAGIKSDSLEFIKSLSEVNLGPLKKVNKPLKIYPEWIRTRLRVAGFDIEFIEVECPSGAMVQRIGQPVPEEEIRLALEMNILKQINVPAENLEIRQFQMRGMAQEIPFGERTYKITSIVDTAKLGRIPFSVDVEVNKETVNRFSGSAHIDVRINAIKSATSIQRGRLITEQDLQIVPTYLSQVPRNTVLNPAGIVGMTANRPVNIGAFIKASDLAKPMLVKRNEPVLILLQKGVMKITTRGVSMQGGSAGDVIQVRNVNSNKMVQAMIVDRQTVKVIY